MEDKTKWFAHRLDESIDCNKELGVQGGLRQVINTVVGSSGSSGSNLDVNVMSLKNICGGRLFAVLNT